MNWKISVAREPLFYGQLVWKYFRLKFLNLKREVIIQASDWMTENGGWERGVFHCIMEVL